MKHNQNCLSILAGITTALVAINPANASSIQVTGVEVQLQENNDIQLTLETLSSQESETPQIFTVSRGNELIADLLNTQLNLADGESFRQENLNSRINAVEVLQLDANSVRLIVEGTNNSPTSTIVQQNSEGITLNFSPETNLIAQNDIVEVEVSETNIPQNNILQNNIEEVEVLETNIPQNNIEEVEVSETNIPQNDIEDNILLAQAPTENQPRTNNRPIPEPEVLFPNPEITIDGGPAPTANPLQPIAPVPPFLPRAVAPPVGDIAVSNVDASPEYVELGTATRVPRLVLREAPVQDVLTLLARAADLNVVYTEAGGEGSETSTLSNISLDLENESVQDVFNSVLMVSGLQASRRGRTIFVSPELPQQARDIIAKSFRLNQVSVSQAAAFLAANGAEAQIVTEVVETTIDNQTGAILQTGGPTAVGTQTTTTTRTPEITTLTSELGENGASTRILEGLLVTTDDRLNAITLIGEPRLVEMASNYLVQLDARRRQAAINVKIVDVNLSNTEDINTSFSFGVWDSFFSSSGGNLNANFGTLEPAQNALGQSIASGIATGLVSPPINPATGTSYPTRFLAELNTQIQNNNAKVLTDPTLVVQEGQTANVNLVQSVITNILTETETTDGITTRTVTTEQEDVGLKLQILMERIDDNGFITLNVSPEVSAVGGSQDLSVGTDTNTIFLVSRRQLSSGSIRMRDNQTLVLAGIIQDSERTIISKVPILGDLPLIGALFRDTNDVQQRSEVIVLVTPQILDDSEQAGWGYNYVPGQEAQELLEDRGFYNPISNF